MYHRLLPNESQIPTPRADTIRGLFLFAAAAVLFGLMAFLVKLSSSSVGGAQIAVMAELRRRHRLMGAAMGAGAVGSGASTAGMIACCAHHLADLLPFLGATAAASFLYDVRLAFMIIGLGINGIALAIGISRLKRITVTATEEAACHAM